MKRLYSIIKDKIAPLEQLFHLSFFRELIRQKKSLLIKLAIPVFIILLGIFSCSYSHRLIRQNIQSIFVISDAIRSHFMNRPDFWGLNTEYALAQNIIPDKFVKDKKIVLRGNIEVLIGSGANAETIMPLVQNFDIIISGLNRAQCISYAESPLTDNQKLALTSISIINSQGTYTFEWGGEYPLPVAQYTTKRLCLDKNNTLIWSLK